MNHLPMLSEIKSLDDILIYTMSQDEERLAMICDHYDVKYPECVECRSMCPTSVAEAVYAKAMKEATNAN